MPTFQNMTVSFGADISKLNSGYAIAEKKTKKFSKAVSKSGKKSRKVTKSIGQDFTKVGKTIKRKATASILAFTAALGLAGAASFKLGKDFTAGVAGLSAITGLMGDDLAILEAEALRLGRTTTKTANQVIEGMKMMGSARAELLGTPEALAAITKEAIILSEAADIDLSVAAEALGNSLNAFGLEASDASDVINTLAAASQLGAKEVPFLIESMREAAPAAKALGISLADTLAFVEALGKGGLLGSVSGTGFRNLTTILNNSGIPEYNIEVLGLVTVLENLKAANLSSIETEKLFGRRVQITAQVIQEQLETFKEIRVAITGTNRAYIQAETRNASFAGQVLKLTSAVEGAQLAIFSKMLPGLTAFVHGITNAATAVTGMSDTIFSLAKQIGTGALAIGIGLALSGLVKLVKKLGSVAIAFATTELAAASFASKVGTAFTGAFLGFKFGVFLRNEFDTAAIAGDRLFNALAIGFFTLRFTVKTVFADIAAAWVFTFDKMIAGVAILFGIAEQINKVFGTNDLAEFWQNAQESLINYQQDLKAFDPTIAQDAAGRQLDASLALLAPPGTGRDMGTAPDSLTAPIEPVPVKINPEDFEGFDQIIKLGESGKGTFSTVAAAKPFKETQRGKELEIQNKMLSAWNAAVARGIPVHKIKIELDDEGLIKSIVESQEFEKSIEQQVEDAAIATRG